MLLSCDNSCNKQMVAGGSTARDCRAAAGPDCSPSGNQNCATDGEKAAQVQSQSNNCNKAGLKRRLEPSDTDGTHSSVVLGSVSTNVVRTHQQVATRCAAENCPTYSTPSPPPQTQCQPPNLGLETGGSGNEGNGNDGSCESCCEGASADYDYESILTKILNEKKLALSRSPEVIQYLSEL